MDKKYYHRCFAWRVMGYDAAVYLVYGIPFSYDQDTGNSLQWLFDLMVPELVEEYYSDDIWGCLDSEPHTGGYYLLNFCNDGKLFLCCWWTRHQVFGTRGGCQSIDMPTDRKKAKFEDWCIVRGIDVSDIGFYSVIAD